MHLAMNLTALRSQIQTVDPKVASQNAQAAADRKAAKEARRKAEAQRRAAQVTKVVTIGVKPAPVTELALVVDNTVSVDSPRKPTIVYMPTEEEQVATKAAYRRKEAEIALRNLLAQKKECNPSRPQFLRWVVGAGFIHNRDVGPNGIYTCEGVEIVVFGGRMGPVEEERHRKVKPIPTSTTVADLSLSPAERRAKNRALNEEQRLAKKARQAAIKAARKPVAKPAEGKKKEDKKKKGGDAR